MRTFIAKNQKNGLKITFKYNFNGVLQVLEFEGDWPQDKVQEIIGKMPAGVDKMAQNISENGRSAWLFAELTEITFDAFYKRYPRKVGRKEETEKAFNKLSEADKMEAILFIEALIKLKNDGTAFPYPATYLNKKYWK
ncbi:hypothetical protein [Chryseobacterium cucumeris]|uniref:hypothetical protein n=1 Tax=Chryseobacterium cucumeris TaxID=1813611 RepID=UPI0037C065F9